MSKMDLIVARIGGKIEKYIGAVKTINGLKWLKNCQNGAKESG